MTLKSLFFFGFWIFLLCILQNKGCCGCMQKSKSDLLTQAEEADRVGDDETAISLYLSLTQQYEKKFGLEHPDTISLFTRSASAYFRAEKYKEALPINWKIYRIKEKLYGPEHEDTVETLSQLGNVYWLLGKFQKAEGILKKAYRLTKSHFGQNHKKTILVLSILANVLRMSSNGDPQRLDLALSYFKKVYDVRAKDPEMGQEHEQTLYPLKHIGDILGLQKKFDEAAEIFQKVLEISTRTLGKDFPLTQDVKKILVETLSEAGRTGQANDILRKDHSNSVSDSDSDQNDETLLRLVIGKATALANKGKYRKALEILSEFYHREILKRSLSANIWTVLDKLVTYSRTLGDLEQTLKWANVVIDLIQNQGQGQGQNQVIRQIQNVQISPEEVRGNKSLLHLNVMESFIYVSSEQNNEKEINKWFENAREVIRGHPKGQGSTVLMDKFLNLEILVADFKVKIGKIDEAIRLYFDIAENPDGGNKSLAAIAVIHDIAIKENDHKILTNVALKFLHHQHRQQPDSDLDLELPGEQKEKDLLRESAAQFLVEKATEESHQENYESAFSLYKTVESIWPKKWENNYVVAGLVLQGLGQSALNLNKFDEGFSYMQKALNMFQEKLVTEIEMSVSEREMIAKQIQNLRKILEVYKEFSTIPNFAAISQAFELNNLGLISKAADRKPNSEL